MTDDVQNPVHYWETAWWFWDETWGYRYGPFPTKEKAKGECEKYGNFLAEHNGS